WTLLALEETRSMLVQCPNSACGKTGTFADTDENQTLCCPHCRQRFSLAAAKVKFASNPSLAAAGTISAERPKPAPQPAAPATAPQPNWLAAGVPARIARFQVRALLGTGAFGAVYRAHDPQLDR